MTSSQTTEIKDLLGQLCNIIDHLERRLRVYDSAIRFFKASNQNYASLLDDSLMLAESQRVVQSAAASDEHGAFRQEALALISRVLKTIK